MQQGLKTLDSAGRVGGYLVVWGNPGERDLQGEYFTPETELGLTWYPQRPVLYQHGLDGALKAAVIGSIDTLVRDETGVWAEAQLDLRQRWAQRGTAPDREGRTGLVFGQSGASGRGGRRRAHPSLADRRGQPDADAGPTPPQRRPEQSRAPGRRWDWTVRCWRLPRSNPHRNHSQKNRERTCQTKTRVRQSRAGVCRWPALTTR